MSQMLATAKWPGRRKKRRL